MWHLRRFVGGHHDEEDASRPTPFLLTVRCGAHASELVGTLAAHRPHETPDELLGVLTESLRGVTAACATRQRDLLQGLLDGLSDPLGAEAYALTTLVAALTVHLADEGERGGEGPRR